MKNQLLPPQIQQQQIQQQHVPYVDVRRQRQAPPRIGLFESIIGTAVLLISALMLMIGQFLAVLMIGGSGNPELYFSAVHEIEAILLIGLGSIGLAQGTMLLRKKK